MFVVREVKKIYKRFVPERWRYFIGKALDSILVRDEAVCLGDLNPRKTFYVIRIAGQKWGALSTWINLMPFVLYGLKKKYIPIIDLKNITPPELLCDTESVGKNNCWDLYFKQPQNNFSLNEILCSRRVVFASWRNVDVEKYKKIRDCDLPLRNKDYKLLKKMNKFCPVSNDIVSYAETLKDKLFPKNEKILAVSYRRAFEWSHYCQLDFTPPGTHLVRGDVHSVFSEIRKFLYENDYNYFFFMVDDRETLELAKEQFKNSCIFIERCMPHYFSNGVPVLQDDYNTIHIEFGKRENDVYLNAKEYLAGVYLMSKCDSFLSCGGSADVVTYVMNDKKFEKIVQLEGKGDVVKHASDGKR